MLNSNYSNSVTISQCYGYAMVILRVTGQFNLENVNKTESKVSPHNNIESGLLVYHYNASNIDSSQIYIYIYQQCTCL